MINYLALQQDHRFQDGTDYMLLSDQSDSSDSDSDLSLSDLSDLDGALLEGLGSAKAASDEACIENPPASDSDTGIAKLADQQATIPAGSTLQRPSRPVPAFLAQEEKRQQAERDERQKLIAPREAKQPSGKPSSGENDEAGSSIDASDLALALSGIDVGKQIDSNELEESVNVSDIAACLDSSHTVSKLELSESTNKKN